MERYKLDVVRKTLIITEGFSRKIKKAEGDEYNLYLRLMNDIPGLAVVRQTHKRPDKYKTKSGEEFSCNQFKNLSYANMERFMSGLPHCDVYFAEYDFIREYATKIQTNGYALVRRWFIAQFPHFRKNPLFYVYNTPAVVPASNVIQEVGEEAATQDEAA